MPRLIWSQGALRDVDRLYQFLAEQNPDAAKRAARTIRRGVRILAGHPEAGRLVDDLPNQFREWVIEFGQSAYVVLYHHGLTEVVLLAVRHGREAGYQAG